MSLTTLKRIAIALVIIVFLWGAMELFTGRSDEIERVAAITAITAGAADTVEFLRSDDTVRLARNGTTWQVNGYPASPQEVDDFFAALAEDVEGELIARSPASHARMGVDSAGAMLRIVAGGETVTQLVVGDQGTGYQTRYVRPAADDRVYLIDGDVARMLTRGVNDWRDKRIVVLDSARVGRIALERDRRSYAVERRDSVWTLAGGAPADTAAVRRLLQGWAQVEAQGGSPFASPAQIDSADFRRPDRTVTLLGLGRDTLARLLFDSTASGFWVRHDSGGTVYKLQRWKANELVPVDSTLRPGGS